MIDWAYTLAGAFTGFVIGLTGVGGGALMTPILLLFFGIAPTTAVATDLWFAAITKIAGARIHHTNGNVDWQVVKRLWAGSLPMASLTVLLISMGAHIVKIEWLTKGIGIIVLITAAGLLVAPKLIAFSKRKQIGQPERFETMQAVLTVLAGAIIGVCVALTSVGAGVLGSVMLLYLYPLRITPHRLVATEIVHAIPLAIIAGLGYLFAGMVDGAMLVSLLIGSIPAVIAGSKLASKIAGQWIRFALAVVLAAAGLKVLL
ncbi:sulfite exporter TauE/SafE family protein [Nitrosomonas sp.]|uniref:sulfite exporter TauE/SafE family protein n=1 Tax=Nitrosomonas sp. TaxID=42353 RepID=UPI0025EA632F|nr:sulfite exporter TauE/SafE family protein [Nitrosomonas sp.]